MKYLLIITLVLASIKSNGQDTAKIGIAMPLYKIDASPGTIGLLSTEARPYTMLQVYQQPQRKIDTVPCVMLVTDTIIGHRSESFSMRGYIVRELAFTEPPYDIFDSSIHNAVYSPKWHPVKTLEYLTTEKKPLDKKLTVWMSK